MPDLTLTERDQSLLRTLMDSDPAPGSPIPERRVLEMLGELVPSDGVVAALREDPAPSFVDVPRDECMLAVGTVHWSRLLSCVDVPSDLDFDDEPSDWCTLTVGTVHWSLHPREAAACGALEGLTDAVAVGFRDGSRAVAQIGMCSVTHMYTPRDLAVLGMLRPVLRRHLRPGPPTALPVPLTLAERRVLIHVAAGRSNSEIAERLFVAPSTVCKHLEHIYSKLGVSNRLAAVVAVRGAPLTDPERVRQVASVG